MALAVFSNTAVDRAEKRARLLAPQGVHTYTMPALPTVLMQAQTGSEPTQPGLLNLDEMFPKRGNRELPEEPESEAAKKVAVLDDLRAVPPKEIFLEAIFLTGDLETDDELPPIKLSRDFTDANWFDLVGDSKPVPIPEPSTALLLSLGLGGLAAIRRRTRSQNTRDRQIASGANQVTSE